MILTYYICTLVKNVYEPSTSNYLSASQSEIDLNLIKNEKELQNAGGLLQEKNNNNTIYYIPTFWGTLEGGLYSQWKCKILCQINPFAKCLGNGFTYGPEIWQSNSFLI